MRVLILVEGHDAAGKTTLAGRLASILGGRVVSHRRLAPGEGYFDRFLEHLPREGEVVVFDRSWYVRATVERVHGFCRPEEVEALLEAAPELERSLVRDGIHLVKLWLEVTPEEQARRLALRLKNGERFTPVDARAAQLRPEHDRAAAELLARTSPPAWHVVPAGLDVEGTAAWVLSRAMPEGGKP